MPQVLGKPTLQQEIQSNTWAARVRLPSGFRFEGLGPVWAEAIRELDDAAYFLDICAVQAKGVSRSDLRQGACKSLCVQAFVKNPQPAPIHQPETTSKAIKPPHPGGGGVYAADRGGAAAHLGA